MSTETETPETAPEYAGLLEKDPSHLHKGYGVWIKDNTGYGPEAPADGEEPSAEWADFLKVIQLAVVLYAKYQRSPENKERKVKEAQEREDKLEAEKAKREEEKAAKAAAKEEEKAAKEASEEAADDGEAPKKKPAAKKGTAAKKAASGAEAPF